MPRPRAAKIETPTSRRKLPPRKKPYYVTVSPGVFLGYCRNHGHCKWSVRVVRGRVEWTDRFATTDDLVDHCCAAWNKLVDQPWRIMSIGLRQWAHGF